jgi:hypothetical protein
MKNTKSPAYQEIGFCFVPEESVNSDLVSGFGLAENTNDQ